VSVIIDIAGLPHDRIRVKPSPLAELGMALHAFTESRHHPRLAAWVTATTARLDPHLADRLEEARFLWGATFSDVFTAFAGLPPEEEAEPAGTLAGELDLLDRVAVEEFVAALLESVCDPSYGAGLYGARTPSPLTDAVVRRRTLTLAAAQGRPLVDFTGRVLADPGWAREWFRGLMTECEEAFFAETWRQVGPGLAADARHTAELLRRKGLGAALAHASPAVTYDEETARITVDKLTAARTAAARHGLTLVPTRLGSPHLMVLHRYGWQPVLHYPVAAQDPPPGPTVEELTLRMEALAHPVRMRMCRMLSRSPYSTIGLAEAHGLSAPEVSRHLAVLKRAGLVTSSRRGRYVLHELDVELVARLGTDFVGHLLR
jgi:DNA-binding transcriptional ArsR family regulator/ribosomal protein S18 acetylase RimI-like enzyme